jgi:hypothetical protein
MVVVEVLKGQREGPAAASSSSNNSNHQHHRQHALRRMDQDGLFE